MKKTISYWAVCAMTALVATTFVACGEKESSAAGGGTGEKLWKSETKEHKNFKDLGNYVIELPDYTDAAIEERGLAAINTRSDKLKLPGGGCTAMVKKNDKGEVIFGRNMDLDISQSPAFVFKTTYGKYKNFCVAYLPNLATYHEMQQMDELPQAFTDMVPFIATDCMNETGLYIEVNLRERDESPLLGKQRHSLSRQMVI